MTDLLNTSCFEGFTWANRELLYFEKNSLFGKLNDFNYAY